MQNSNTQKLKNLGFTYSELSALNLPEREEIICGLARGEVGLLNAVNNVGKTTLLRNLMISLCISDRFEPLCQPNRIHRIAFLDFEDTLSGLRKDLETMFSRFDDEKKYYLGNHILFICEARDEEDEDYLLSNQTHFDRVSERLRDFKPDLIIVDTISSAFHISNENDNAEVRNRIMLPLRRLARNSNAALIAAHHIGKSKGEEGQTREISHKGRGASSFADLSRLVLNLEHDSLENCVLLSCAKIKGKKFEDTLLRLNEDARWFSRQGVKKVTSNYEILMGIFSDGLEYSTGDVLKHFAGVLSESSVKKLLKRAGENGDLFKIKQGVYRKCQNVIPIGNYTTTLSEATA